MSFAMAMNWIDIMCQNKFIHNLDTQVKGQGFIAHTLEIHLRLIQSLSRNFPEIKDLEKSFRSYIDLLEKNYDEIGVKDGRIYLLKTDAEILSKVIREWLARIFQIYSIDGTVLISNINFNDFIPNKIVKRLDSFAKGDLNDGISALAHLLPTPAAGILLRVAERILQKYYERVIGKKSGKKTWGQMLHDLEKNPKVDKPLLGYLYYLNEKRIDSTHPYRRYSQEEGERILLNVKDLLESVYSKKKK